MNSVVILVVMYLIVSLVLMYLIVELVIISGSYHIQMLCIY